MNKRKISKYSICAAMVLAALATAPGYVHAETINDFEEMRNEVLSQMEPVYEYDEENDCYYEIYETRYTEEEREYLNEMINAGIPVNGPAYLAKRIDKLPWDVELETEDHVIMTEVLEVKESDTEQYVDVDQPVFEEITYEDEYYEAAEADRYASMELQLVKEAGHAAAERTLK